jgi:hypothetical protein
MLQEIIDIQTARAQAYRRERGGNAAPALHAEHQRTLELIAAGAADEAEQHWRMHLEHVRARRLTVTTTLELSAEPRTAGIYLERGGQVTDRLARLEGQRAKVSLPATVRE